MSEDANAENDRQRERLKRLGAGLREGDWSRRLANGWTVQMAFVHLGFWDRLSLGQLERCEREGVRKVPHDVELLNAAVADLASALSPRDAFNWTVRAAEAVDARVRGLSPSLAAEVVARDTPRRLHRHLHRREHLDKVEELLRR